MRGLPPSAPGPLTSLWPVVAAGALSVLVYWSFFTIRWPLRRLYDQPHLDYAWLSRYSLEGQAAYLGGFLLLFALQYAAYLAVRGVPGHSTRLLAVIVGGQLFFGLMLVDIYPVAALDVYDYLMYGRIGLVYGGNPFTQPPAAFGDPIAGFSPWPNEPSVYGPIWQLISLIPTALSGGSLLGGLVAFKLTGLLFFIACTLTIWRLMVALQPDWAAAGSLLFAWNPLLVFELVGNAHNDAAMVLLVLLAIVALVRGPRLLVLPLLTAAILTKLLAAVLGPVFLVGLIAMRAATRDKVRWVLGGGALSLALTVALYAPYWEGTRTLHFLTRGNWFTASLPTMLREYLRGWLELEEAGRTAATMVAAIFAVFVAIRLGWFWWQQRRRAFAAGDWDGWLAAAHDVTFGYLAFACIWWEPWYLTWLVALAALVPRRVLHDRALLFCYGGVINYVVFKYIWPVYQPMTYTQIMGISVILIFGLPLLHLACTLGVELGGKVRGARSRGYEAGLEPFSPSL